MKTKHGRLSITIVVCLSVAVWLCAGFLIVPGAWGQGTVTFNNRISGTGGWTTHVWAPSSTAPDIALVGLGSNDNPSGTTRFGSASAMAPIGSGGSGGKFGNATTLAQLLAAPGADQPESSLVTASPTTTFRSGTSLGAVAGVTAALSNVAKDAPVATLQMVAWDNSSGMYSTWAQACSAWKGGLIEAGKSVPLNVYNIGGGTNAAPTMAGLQSFNLYHENGNYESCILVNPQSQTATLGQRVPFRVFVGCTGDPVSYQWKFGGVDIPNATNDVFIIPSAGSGDAGDYSVGYWTAFYSSPKLSSNATLTVLAPPSIVISNLFTAVQLQFFARTSITYYMQASPDLGNWTNADGPINGNGQTWSKTYPIGGAGRLFYRVWLAL